MLLYSNFFTQIMSTINTLHIYFSNIYLLLRAKKKCSTDYMLMIEAAN